MDLFETLSGLAVKYLPRERLLAVRDAYHGLRHKMYPLMRLAYGSFDTQDLKQHLEQQLTEDYDILMVHSSVNNMAPMYDGNPKEILDMLKELCGPNRTLVMPAFYLGDPKLGDVVASYQAKPQFDMRRTPSQMGMVTELFRRTKGTLHSRHPTHRVTALGPLAEQITSGHIEAGTTFGADTPFDVMARYETQILGIGKPFEVLTQVHHAEDLLGDPFPVPGKITELPVTLRNRDKTEEQITLRWRKFDWPRNMWLLRNYMTPETLREWQFHHVPLFATRARSVTEALLDAAKNNKTLYESPKQ